MGTSWPKTKGTTLALAHALPYINRVTDVHFVQALPQLIKPQAKTTTDGRTIIKGPAVKARQLVAWRKEFEEHQM